LVEFNWRGSLHQTFRINNSSPPTLTAFLTSEGLHRDLVLEKLPYDSARAKNRDSTGPDPKRYRDAKQVFQTIGLIYEDADSKICVTHFGETLLRWLSLMNNANAPILMRHAAYALASCQLNNPTGAGSRYSEDVVVFPFQFIWKAMLSLDGIIDSEELNRSIFKTRNEEELYEEIDKIKNYRTSRDLSLLGDEAITGSRKNDRIIPWISLASFGWALIKDKRESTVSGYYQINENMYELLSEASKIRHKHRNFTSTKEYVEYISSNASLPEDLR
jgi:hypothetical protein